MHLSSGRSRSDNENAGQLVTGADTDAALRRAWREISTVVDVAVILAGGIAILAR